MTSPLTPERKQARQLKNHYGITIEHARSSGDLSDAGRGRQIAALSDELKTRLQVLREQERTRLQAEHGKLETQAFGGAVARRGSSPSDVISLRDAVDRASQLKTPQEAAELLQRAHDTADESLAAATARHAFRRSLESQLPGSRAAWGNVVEQYAQHPGRAARVQPVFEKMADIEDALRPSPNLMDDFVSFTPPEARRGGVWGGGQPTVSAPRDNAASYAAWVAQRSL